MFADQRPIFELSFIFAGVPTALAEQMSEVISKSGFGRALRNAISTNVLERLFHGMMRVTSLAAVEPEDFWGRHSSRFPKREAGSSGACFHGWHARVWA